MRTVSRLRLLCCASTARNSQPYGFCFAELSTCLLFALSNPNQAHQKHTIPTRALRGFFHLGQLCAYGGPGGFRTRVQNLFLSASYNHTKIHIIYFSMVPLVGFELTTYRLQGGCSTNWAKAAMAPKAGIEPTTNWLTVNCTTAVLLWNFGSASQIWTDDFQDLQSRAFDHSAIAL